MKVPEIEVTLPWGKWDGDTIPGPRRASHSNSCTWYKETKGVRKREIDNPIISMQSLLNTYYCPCSSFGIFPRPWHM